VPDKSPNTTASDSDNGWKGGWSAAAAATTMNDMCREIPTAQNEGCVCVAGLGNPIKTGKCSLAFAN
jgi:hypothetical protein